MERPASKDHTVTRLSERGEAERLLEQLTHIRTPRQDGTNPEADTLLLEIIARMTLALDDRLERQETARKLSEPHSGLERTETDTDTSQPGTVAALVHGTHQHPGVIRAHFGPSGHAQLVEPDQTVEARAFQLVPGDVVTQLYEYPLGYTPMIYLGHISHPLLPDTETLIWWSDGGPTLMARVDRMKVVGILLPSTDEERQERLRRWTEVVD